MTDNSEMFQSLHDIVQSIDSNQSNADWGRDFGRAVFDTDDEDLIVYVLSDAGETYRSAELSKLRKRTRSAAFSLTKSSNGERAAAVQTTLEFPCVVPGFPQLPLGDTWHLFLVDACSSARRHIDGAIQNVEVMERAREASAEWPLETIRSLILRGALTPEDLAGFERFA